MKKKIRQWLFGNEIEQLWSTQGSQDRRLSELEKKEYKCEHTQDFYHAVGILQGLLQYLGVEPHEEWVDDMSYLPIEQPKKKVYKITKSKKPNL